MGLNAGGVFFMALAWGVIITLTGYTFFKVLKGDKKKEN